MGGEEKKLRDRYGAICAELGDVMTRLRLATRRQGELEREIDALNAALPAAVQADMAAAAAEAPPRP